MGNWRNVIAPLEAEIRDLRRQIDANVTATNVEVPRNVIPLEWPAEEETPEEPELRYRFYNQPEPPQPGVGDRILMALASSPTVIAFFTYLNK